MLNLPGGSAELVRVAARSRTPAVSRARASARAARRSAVCGVRVPSMIRSAQVEARSPVVRSVVLMANTAAAAAVFLAALRPSVRCFGFGGLGGSDRRGLGSDRHPKRRERLCHQVGRSHR
jgi:hypothetical protein